MGTAHYVASAHRRQTSHGATSQTFVMAEISAARVLSARFPPGLIMSLTWRWRALTRPAGARGDHSSQREPIRGSVGNHVFCFFSCAPALDAGKTSGTGLAVPWLVGANLSHSCGCGPAQRGTAIMTYASSPIQLLARASASTPADFGAGSRFVRAPALASVASVSGNDSSHSASLGSNDVSSGESETHSGTAHTLLRFALIVAATSLRPILVLRTRCCALIYMQELY